MDFGGGECETKWLIVVCRKLRHVNIITKLQRKTVKVTVCVVYLKTISTFLELDISGDRDRTEVLV